MEKDYDQLMAILDEIVRLANAENVDSLLHSYVRSFVKVEERQEEPETINDFI